MSAEQAIAKHAGEFGTADPRELKFDLQNPRYVDESINSEEQAIEYLIDHADVDELIKSILSTGYVDFEPMIVLHPANIVLEGNRRLAALRLLDSPELRRSLKVTLPNIEREAPVPTEIRVLRVRDREDARSYIGFKHINGPFKWDALAKAQYAADWILKGGTIDSISRSLGDNHSTVRRLVNGWFVLQQARKLGFDLEQTTKKNFPFSHLYTALSRPAVRSYLGLDGADVSTDPDENVVPEEFQDNLLTFMSWLYGQEDKDEPSVIRSQNPNLTELTRVLANREATLILTATRNLEVAYDRVEPQSIRFDRALVQTVTSAETAARYVSHYQGDPTLLMVADNIAGIIDSILVVMRSKAADGGDRRR